MPKGMAERNLTHHELELLAHSILRTEVTYENLPVLRLEVAEIREKKGMDREVLEVARWVRKGAERIGAYEDVVNLYWEECLVGKHLIMAARDRNGLWSLPLKAAGIADGYRLMRAGALSAEEYINAHGVETCKPRAGRFLGEVASLERNYPKAVDYYQRSVELFRGMEDWGQRVNSLELSGFLAEALILSGETQEGIEVAASTFTAYNEGDGAILKEKDYYTWAVWKSGCAVKVWHALLARGISLEGEQRTRLISMLAEAESLLVIPEDKETWGDKNFEFRRGEIASIKRQVSLN